VNSAMWFQKWFGNFILSVKTSGWKTPLNPPTRGSFLAFWIEKSNAPITPVEQV